MMNTDKLTRKALEQHDKVHPKLQATKTKNSSTNKDEHSTVKGRIRTESLSTANDVSKPRPFERQTSRASVLNSKRTPSLSVFRVVQAARTWKRLSQRKPAPPPEKPKVQLENTYRLGPESDQVFKPEKVKNVLRDILSSFLRKFSYSQEGSKQMTLCLTNEIKARVKDMHFPRYKIICNVIMMQNKGQGSEVSSRCIWNTETDSFASYTHNTPNVICIANVHAIYYE